MGDTSVILLLYFDHIFVNLSIGKLSEKGIFFSSHSSTVERFWVQPISSDVFLGCGYQYSK